MQNVLIIVMFIGLMLIAAGIGALVAGESGFGMIFLIAGAAILVIDILILIMVRRRRAD